MYGLRLFFNECMWLSAGDTQIVRCREVVHSSECPLLEVPLYTVNTNVQIGAGMFVCLQYT